MKPTTNNACGICTPLKSKPELADYFKTIKKWKEYVLNGKFEFIAGDCPLEDIEEHFYNEDLYTIMHYFKCECGKFYRAGACIRSTVPIVEEIDAISKDLEKRFLGKFAQLYLENI